MSWPPDSLLWCQFLIISKVTCLIFISFLVFWKFSVIRGEKPSVGSAFEQGPVIHCCISYTGNINCLKYMRLALASKKLWSSRSFLNPWYIISLYQQSFAFKSSVVPLTPLHCDPEQPFQVKSNAMQAILYGEFRFNPSQCSVMQSGEVKHSLQQSSAVKCIAVWPVQSYPAHSSPVSSTQVKSHPYKYIAVYFHPEQPKSI